jgi:Resolvase, N terminal domain/Helix-turn-helix
MRVILYCRVSTLDQADNGVSLEAQGAKLTAYANQGRIGNLDSHRRCLYSAPRSGRSMKRNIIDQLRKAVAESDESQLSIANALDIDQGNLNRFVRGERSISIETAAKLCDYLKLDLIRRGGGASKTPTDTASRRGSRA